MTEDEYTIVKVILFLASIICGVGITHGIIHDIPLMSKISLVIFVMLIGLDQWVRRVPRA